MRTTTKIIAGFAALTALMAGLVVLQIIAMQRIQSINRNLSTVNFLAALGSLDLLRTRDQVEEYARKLFVLGDPQYAALLLEFEQEFESTLRDLQTKGRSPGEQQALERLTLDWSAFRRDLEREQGRLKPGSLAEFPAHLDEQLARLRERTQALYQATLAAVELEVERSAVTGRQAEQIQWIVAALALTSSILVSFFIARSILNPLGQLTEGTQRISRGQFDYRLSISGDDELSQLARDFNAMTRRLREVDELKKDFVSHVSHELKAPLASIRETHQLLLEELPGPLTGKQRRFLELNLQGARRLSSMIDNLLDLSRMEAGVMEYELKDNDLAALTKTVAAEFEAQARDRNLKIRTEFPEQPLKARCDGDRIIQVLGNIVGNAVKFSPGGGEIRINISPAGGMSAGIPPARRHLASGSGGDGEFLLVTVADSGPGVRADNKARIFEKFRQVRHTNELAVQGAGLGLAISRTIVKAHGGLLWVEDNPGGGSIFCLLLPAGPGSPKGSAGTSAPI